MNQEIKEILNKLNNKARHYILYDYEVKTLKDYITNLQQKNKSLRGSCKVLGEKNENQRKELVSLNDRLKEVKKSNGYLKQENKDLKTQLKGTTHCYDEEEHKRLWQENKRLKEKHYLIQGGRGNCKTYIMILEKELEDYKSRIDKAIELLKNWEKEDLDNLLAVIRKTEKILQGSDKK